MAQTQLASMFLGAPVAYEDYIRKEKDGAIIHITRGTTDEILDVITERNIIEDTHRQSLPDTLETFDFVVIGGERYDQYLTERNRVVIPAEEQGFLEFIIHEVSKYRDNEGLKAEVYTVASYLDLKKAGVIEPQRLESYTASAALGFALDGTEWRVGNVEGEGTRTFDIKNHTNPYSFIKTIAREFELEPFFHVETDGNRVIARYVDLLRRIGEWRGREIELGKDLFGIQRNENSENVYTALVGLGPEREDGTRLEVFVEDEEALQRWGRPHPQTGRLMHLIDVYEPESTREDMTLEELRQYTRTELEKRINEVVTYETDVTDLENVPGMENKKIRFGDTIRIKDTKFNPPLYLEARVFEQERSIVDKSRKKIKLGDYTEYTEEEVMAIWEQLAERIREKISAQELYEYTYDKLTIDNKDEQVRTDTESYANTVSQQAKDEAITYTNNTVEPIVVSVGQLEDDIKNVEDNLGNIDTRLSTAETNITQAFDEIELRATKTELDTVEQRVEIAEGEISTLAGEIELRATKTEVNALEGRVSQAEASISVLSDEIELKVEEDGVRSIFRQEASSFTFEASQINFEGHVFGQDATFTGKIEGATIEGSEFISLYIDDLGRHRTMRLSDSQLVLMATGADTIRESTITIDAYGLQHDPTPRVPEFRMESDIALIGSLYVRDDVLVGESVIFNYPVTSAPGDRAEVATTTSSGRAFLGLRSKEGGTSGGAINIYSELDSTYPGRVRIYGGGSMSLEIRENGIPYVPYVWDNTTTNPNNVRVDINGQLLRYSSARRFKIDEKVLDEDPYKILALQPKDWYDKRDYEENGNNTEGLRRVPGLVAEDVEDAGLGKFLEYEEDGQIAGLMYERLWTLLIPIVKEQQERIEALEEAVK